MVEKKVTKIFQKKPYSIFTNALKVLNISPSELVGRLGYSSTSAWSEWESNGEIPFVAGVALELMVEKETRGGRDQVYLLRLSPAKAAMLNPLLKGLELEFVVL